MKNCILLLLTAIFFVNCGGPEPRKPVKVTSGSFFKESVERNKELLAQEEKAMQKLIERDSANEYVHSSTGSWYYYETRNEQDEYTPQPDDLVSLTYALMTFEGDTIYSQDEIGVFQYKVDKQELFPGLRNSVKLLKEGETAVFLFPSSLGFGYHGDNNKIGVNVPLKARVTLLKIEEQHENVDEIESE
ncbi:MAG: gliding motility-associated peptidyl-prolyl isomerase GldI [Pseudozobellia sp.]|nr:gliding motility-associated peptidyl-prolyl isomerase GldI [Pseudozobellia sp.]MBG50440.1 gliding motility-associated peptidyl-prolyl isomerase GldI [Pseudozobellia sp.]|tara:strand:+ start:1539 stop:2105 length:567 start_codon:yes stop_codon:yes gene_type:complete